MGWTALSFSFGGLLTSSDMNSMYDNIDLLRFSPANVQVFNASGTYTKSADVYGLMVLVIGGGGGGATRSSTNAPCSPGAGGGAVLKWIDATSVGATETVTVGGGGAGASSDGDGNDGNESSFGSFCAAAGGGKGYSGSVPSLGGIGSGSGIGSGDYLEFRGQSIAPVPVDTVGFPGGSPGYLASFSRYDTNADSPGAGGAAKRTVAGDGADGMVLVIEYK